MDLLGSLGEIDYVVTSEHFGFVGLRTTMETQCLGAGVAEKHFGRNLFNEKYCITRNWNVPVTAN